jgi:hypothetical protein
MGALVSLVAQNVRRTADARQELRATRLAEGKLREILFSAEKGELPDPGTNQGAFEGDDEDMAFQIDVEPYEIPVPRGTPQKAITGSGMFAGGGKSALRRVTLKVYPAEGGDPEQAAPFTAFVAEPNPAAEPTPGQEGEQQPGEQGDQPADDNESPNGSEELE